MAVQAQTDTSRAVQRVLVTTLALNLVVAISKIIIGMASGALTITADGFHSLVDGASNLVALLANRIAHRPPDDDHPYGHRRFETMASLLIGAFLLVTAWEIVSSAWERLQGSGEKPTITPLTFGVMLATLGVNLFVTRYESRAGKRLRSVLLLADAAHTATDVYVSLSVLVSLVFMVLLGWFWVDTVAALLIVALILKAAWEILSQTSSVLMDKAPYTPERLTALVVELPSVEHVVRARSRGPADAAYIDIDVQVPPETTADRAEAIAGAIRDRFNQQLDGVAEVEVHFVPASNGSTDYALLARARADALGLATHEVRLTEGTEGKVLEMHVEVPPNQTLGAAHEQVSQLEHDLSTALPDVAEVVTHIEPALKQAQDDLPPGEAKQMAAKALTLLQTHYPGADWHHLNIYPMNNGFALTLHAGLPPQMSLEAAHRIAEAAEITLRAEMPQLERVTIHTEPPENG